MLQIMSSPSQSVAGSGVCGHSSDEFWGEYAVFSVGNSPLVDNQFKNWCLSNGVNYKPLFGCYKGETETSFLIHLEDLPKVRASRFLNGQESILLLLSKPHNLGGGRHYRKAELLFCETDEKQDIGRFVQKAKDYALKQDAWTYDPLTGTYWVCE